MPRLKVIFLAVGASLMSVTPASSGSAIHLDPFPSEAEVSVTTVHNYYGTCGAAVVQVLGVERDAGDFFVIDPSAAEGSSIVVIATGGQRSLTLRDALSDYNAVACVSNQGKDYLLVGSDCGGTACGRGFNYTVVDIDRLSIVAGGENAPCDDKCAKQITGSTLPYP